MPRCRIDADASPKFQKLLRKLERDYRRIKEDLREAFRRIEEAYTKAAHATAIPRFGGRVWKYRWRSSDLQRGAQGSIRIIAFHDPDNNVLYPILVYVKSEKEDVSAQEIEKAIDDLRQALAQTEEPSSQEPPEQEIRHMQLED